MKIFRIIAIMVGALTIFFGGSSCKKDECCNWVDGFGDSYSYCQDSEDWKSSYATWSDVVDEANYYHGKCK